MISSPSPTQPTCSPFWRLITTPSLPAQSFSSVQCSWSERPQRRRRRRLAFSHPVLCYRTLFTRQPVALIGPSAGSPPRGVILYPSSQDAAAAPLVWGCTSNSVPGLLLPRQVRFSLPLLESRARDGQSSLVRGRPLVTFCVGQWE